MSYFKQGYSLITIKVYNLSSMQKDKVQLSFFPEMCCDAVEKLPVLCSSNFLEKEMNKYGAVKKNVVKKYVRTKRPCCVIV